MIGKTWNISHHSAANHLVRFGRAGLSLPLPHDLADAGLKRNLTPGQTAGRLPPSPGSCIAALADSPQRRNAW